MPIRKAIPQDLTAIRSCAEAAYQRYVDRIGKKPAPMVADFGRQIRDGIVQVYVDEDDKVAGFIVFFPKEDLMFLENVAVEPSHHRRGIGKRLILFCEFEAVRAGLSGVELYTNERMTENLKLYPMLGYTEVDRRTEDGFNRVYFRKKLK